MTSFKEIEKLVQVELEEANKQHPPFNSDHETWAVIQEEVEECTDELETLNMAMEVAWANVRRDVAIDASLSTIHKRALKVAAEAIQVAAMCEKGLRRYDVK